MNTEFTLPKRCQIGTITIREVFGYDEGEAIIAAENNDSDPKDELINLSIVAVDGSPCLPGDGGFDKWTTKTRAVVKSFYEAVNGYEPSELIPLIEEAEENGTSVVEGTVRTKYEFPDDCDVGWVILREMMETDERAGAAAGKLSTETMMARCIIETNDGKRVGAKDLDNWNCRTRNILTVYWSGMNFVPEEELAPLIKAAKAANQAVKANVADSVETSSPSGSGSAAPVAAESP